jgi:hypothetical protein
LPAAASINDLYGWIPQGFNTLDLKAAKALLNELPVSALATQEISEWLEKLGMSEYAQRFADNDIDSSVLPP